MHHSALLLVIQATATAPPDDLASSVQTFSSRFVAYLPDIGAALAILIFGWWFAEFLRGLSRRMMHGRRVDPTVSLFLGNLLYWLLLLIVVTTALETLGLKSTSLMAVLGASALAVGLALQNSLTNFASGVIIVLFRYFRVGDAIEAGGVAGVVEEIGIFDTILVGGDNRRIILPNGKVLGGPIINGSTNPTRILGLTFSISYDSDLKQAKAIILSVVKADPRTLPTPAPAVVVANLADKSVDLALSAGVNSGDHDGLRASVLETVKLRFDDAKIVLYHPD